MRTADGEFDRIAERVLPRRGSEQFERIARHRAVVASALEGVGNGIVALEQHLRLFEIALALKAALLEAVDFAIDRAH